MLRRSGGSSGHIRKVFSRLTGFSERPIATWEAGVKPDEPGPRRIRETQRFQAKLAEVVRPDEIPPLARHAELRVRGPETPRGHRAGARSTASGT
jgi:hypothetical protein